MNEAAARLSTIAAFFQLVTLRVFSLTRAAGE
jgi:hypothetical protein